MPVRPARRLHETAKLIREHADRIADDPSRAVAEARMIRRLAEDLDEELDYEIRQAERRGGLPRSKPKQAKAVVGYCIEQGRYGIALSEHRSSGAAPFRCPKPVYELIAEVINDAPESFRFNDVYEEVRTRTGEDVPDYQVRVTIRFLIHHGAIKHYKAKFINEQKRSFRRIAKDAWDNLQRQTEAGQIPA
ncbi:MAG: hypothetical protein CMJ31_00415 [Phycisphaerae bacterium]|nr:hypothetical protein [Phycisphaerae bacterium]